jgi:phospholipid/cholesterol/gamma-HCH transport system permease protein
MAWTAATVGNRIELAGELRIGDGAAIWRELHVLASEPPPALDIDVSHATVIDGAIMALLVDVRASLVATGTRCELIGAEKLVHLYRGDRVPAPAPVRVTPRLITRLGAATSRLLRELGSVVTFAGELVGALGQVVRRRATANWRSLPTLVERAGADGMVIVLLLNFLVGFVGAFQSTVPLEQFGANVYVADIIGVSVTRELAPLITAIIISGRSGAAFAAELGTMRVSEEIDALRTLGFAPHPYLVVPRVIALAIVAPVLTLLGDVAGVLGGLAVGVGNLGLTTSGFFTELRRIVELSDVWTGLIKSVAFGITIGLIGCQQGLSARGAAAGVGRSTTATVVACLFAIVILDTLFTMLFRGFGV